MKLLPGDLMSVRVLLENELHDDLTGVYSRASLDTRLLEGIERARQHAHYLSLLLLAVDHFKSVNDAFGHAHGDRVLNESARHHYIAKRAWRNRLVEEDPAPAAAEREVLPEEPARLIERDLALQILHAFLETLPERKRGVLTVNGPEGSGKTRFLAEARKIARLQGYVVLTLRGNPALKNRLYCAARGDQFDDTLSGTPISAG
jgi:hypothetical protein